MLTEILHILEIIGTVAFAVSGAFVAVNARLDIFGVLFIGCITAVGGGIMRDILIGVTPPAVFSNVYILLVAAVTSLAVFLIAYVYRKKFNAVREKVEHVNTFFDAVGLAAFSVMGTEIAFVHGISGNAVLTVTLGMLTGVGGGIFRDILTDTTPYIFKKHVYALASIGGAALYYVLRLFVRGALLPTLAGMAFVIVIRILAAKYRWSLPKIRLDEEKTPQPTFTEQVGDEKKAS
ncbi:MAG: trimeric intracellular cation channel family protein [Clostridia bacterium]|nr:trimeric intracellular cation channel family protein [Clostridia bacterium]